MPRKLPGWLFSLGYTSKISHSDREYKDPNDVLLESYRSLYIDIVSDLYVHAPIYQYQGTLLLVSTARYHSSTNTRQLRYARYQVKYCTAQYIYPGISVLQQCREKYYHGLIRLIVRCTSKICHSDRKYKDPIELLLVRHRSLYCDHMFLVFTPKTGTTHPANLR